MKRCSERGQALPAAALLVCGLVLVAMVVMVTARTANVAAQAQTAADAAALAAVSDGETGARQAAEANGADLINFSSDDGTALVEVQIDNRRASARAESASGVRNAADGAQSSG